VRDRRLLLLPGLRLLLLVVLQPGGSILQLRRTEVAEASEPPLALDASHLLLRLMWPPA
jgi:hypothetical protein